MDEIKQDIRQFVAELVPNGTSAKVTDATPLRTSGMIDSMGLLRLVGMVEDKFGIEVSAYEAGVENFDRIDDIAALVERKRMAQA
jgi:acyl carrier protein